MIGADQGGDVRRQGIGGQRPGRDDHRLAPGRSRDGRDLLADDGDEGMIDEGAGDRLREPIAIDGERGAGRHTALVRRPHDERAEPPHFFFQETDGVIELVTAK